MAQTHKGKGKGGGRFLPSTKGLVPPIITRSIPVVGKARSTAKTVDAALTLVPGYQGSKKFGLRNLFR